MSDVAGLGTEARVEVSPDGLVRTLAATTLLLWLGASAVLPLLPEYLRGKGASSATVGLVMGSYFVASLLSLYPAGRIADHIGRRPVLLGGLAIYACGSLGFVLNVSPFGDAGFRALQGFGAGSAEVASLAVISGGVTLERRGRAFGVIYGGQLAGMAIGPLVGSVIGVGSMNVVFVGAAVAAAAAAVPVAGSRALRAEESRFSAFRVTGHTGLPDINRALLGALMASAAFGLVVGVYETCWTLLLELRGASQWQIGLSWTLFAVPFVVMSRPAGWLADHLDRRYLAVGATAVGIGFCALYPFLHSVPLLLALGVLEAIGTAVALPATQSLLAQSSRMEELGRVQGLFSTSETAAIAFSATIGGVLFGAAAWAPFVAAAALAAVLVACLPVVWAPVEGRASLAQKQAAPLANLDPRPGPM